MARKAEVPKNARGSTTGSCNGSVISARAQTPEKLRPDSGRVSGSRDVLYGEGSIARET